MRKTALITWASSGIWQACAEYLAMEGFDLILLARRTQKLEDVKTALESIYDTLVTCITCDVTDYEAIDTIAKDIQQPIHVVINNAGLALGKSSFQDAERDELVMMVNVNILWLVKIAKSFMPHLIEGQGHLVNISSISGVMPYPWGHVYGGTKSFVNQFSNNLRIDLLWTKVRVTDIAPGKVNTEFSLVRFKGDQKTADSEYIGYQELQAENIAQAVWLLRYPTTTCKYRLYVS